MQDVLLWNDEGRGPRRQQILQRSICAGEDRTIDCVVISVAATHAKTATATPVTTVPGLIPGDLFRREAFPERD